MAPATSSKQDNMDISRRGQGDRAHRPAGSKTKRATDEKLEDFAPKPRTAPVSKRDGRVDVDVDHPPPPYTPSIALHASTIPYTAIAGGPTSTSTPSGPNVATLRPHGANVGLLIGAVLASGLLILVLAVLGRHILRRQAGKILLSHPRFSMLQPREGSKQADFDKISGSPEKLERHSSHLGQFVYISTSADELQEEAENVNEVDADQFVPQLRTTLHPQDQTDIIMRRHSTPPTIGHHEMRTSTSINTATMPPSQSAPASPDLSGPLDRVTSLWIQRQKAAELAQIVRMRIVREDMPVHKAVSCPDFVSDGGRARASMLLDHGLGIVQEDQEVDIASTALSALQRYSIAVDPMSPNIPITNFFQIDKEGRVLRLPSSPVTPASDAMPATPLSPSSSGVSSFSSDGCPEEVENAVIVRMAQARSMEIKRGTLLSVNLPDAPPVSRSAPMLLDAQLAATEKSFPTPPPTLSPIAPSSTLLSADIEQSLEARVFAYRDSGAWSKQHYKLTTPGQVRALAESLAIARPVSVHHQTERGWPWPAHRSSVISR